MDTGAMFFMGVTWVIVVGLNVFCFRKIFGPRK